MSKDYKVVSGGTDNHLMLVDLRGPDGARVLALAGLLGVPVKEILRRKESVVVDAADLPDLDDDAALADWIASHPIALERPIVVSADGQRAVVGRPPENVSALIE